MFGMLLLAIACSHQAQQPPAFHVAVDAVQIDVFVGRDGKALEGLTSEDFVVHDAGVRQKVRMVAVETQPLTAILAFDTSESVRGEKLLQLKAAARTFLAGLEEKDRASFLTFSSCLQLRGGLVEDASTLYEALALTEAAGSTSLYDGLFAALRLTERARRPLVLLFTDGRDTSSWLSDIEVLKVLQQSNAVVYAVSLRTVENLEPFSKPTLPGQMVSSTNVERIDPEMRFLREATEMSGGRLVFAETPKGLTESFERILAEMKTRYLLSYTPAGVEPEGWHKLEVEVKRRGVDVRARRGYWKRSLQ